MVWRLQLFSLINNNFLVFIGAMGGSLLGALGIPMGWMLGSLLGAAITTIYSENTESTNNLNPIWRKAGQMILAVQVGQQINATSLGGLNSGHNLIILLFSLISILLLSCITGVLFSKLTRTSVVTGILAVCPGGVSSVPLLSHEMEANPFMVSTTHVLRVLVVACTMPSLSSLLGKNTSISSTPLHIRIEPVYENSIYELLESLSNHPLLWTLILILGAIIGIRLFHMLKFPQALLLGSIAGVGVTQYLASSFVGLTLNPWLPQWLNIIMQIFIGASLGASFNRKMFSMWKTTIGTSLIVIMLLVLTSLFFSWAIHEILAIPFNTAILSFAPGGIAVMTATALSVHANVSFVASVQTMRLVLILMMMALISLLTKWKKKRSLTTNKPIIR